MNYFEKNGGLSTLAASSETSSFSSIVDHAFKMLWEKKVELVMRRIAALDQDLITLEQELNDFISKKRN